MYGWRFALGTGLLALAAACGGKAGQDDTPVDPIAGAGAGGVSPGTGGRVGSGGRVSSGGSFSSGGSPQPTTGGTPFVDPGCPNVEPPPAIKECDPLAAVPTCPAGSGCYPFVDHPFGQGCGAQTYGALCLEAGTGSQGAACGDGTDGCAPSFICVVGALPGRHCAKLCTFDGQNDCPIGMICGDVDIDGYGVCF
jgi:hypothetical protein